jgi:hypothetical protein
MALIARALTTLPMAKQHLNIGPSDTSQDTRLELFINAATSRIESMTDRLLKEGSIAELQHGGRQDLLLLRQYPITAVTEVRIDGTKTFTDPNTIVTPDQYIIGDDGNTLAFKFFLPRGTNNIKIIYTAGYNSTDYAGRLAELEMCCLWLVEWFYRHRDRADMGRTSKSKGDESTGILAQMPTMIAEIIRSYTRMEAPIANVLTGNI